MGGKAKCCPCVQNLFFVFVFLIFSFRANMRELDPFLGAYPFDHTLKRWLGLTSFITASTVARLQPITGRIASVTVHGDGKLDAPAMDTSQEEEEQGKWNERKEIK